MNHIKWIDFNPNNYEEYKAMLLPAFKTIVPCGGRRRRSVGHTGEV